MKVKLDCIPCLLSQSLDALRFAQVEREGQIKVIKTVLSELSQFDPNSSSMQLGQKVHRIVREEANLEDPYKEQKEKSNRQALQLYPRLKERVEESDDPLNTAIRLAIAGNIIDFGPRGDYQLEETVDRCLQSDFGVDHYRKFKERLTAAGDVLYFADNAGEIVFDRILIETLLEGWQLEKIYLVVKGGPFLNDATLADARAAGLDKTDSVEFREATSGDPGTGPDYESRQVISWIEESDLIVSKGQGNFEGLSELETTGLFFLLVAKCPAIGAEIGVETGQMVLLES